MSRDQWCTPKWLADLIGPVDLDPCSNERSHIQAMACLCGLLSFDDGLKYAPTVHPSTRTFINPPYSRGEVLQWIRAYKHTDFQFLLRFDPSTEWFAELMELKPYIWFAKERINFEKPPDVEIVGTGSNPFPHAIYSKSRPHYAEHGYLLSEENISSRLQSRVA